MRDNWKVWIAALCLTLGGAVWGWAAGPHYLWGDPEQVLSGNLVLGNSSGLTTPPTTLVPGHLTLLPGGSSTYGDINLQIKTAGGVVYDNVIHGGITQGADLDWTWPVSYPASSGYALVSTTAGVFSFAAIGSGTVGGSGTDNHIPRWDGTSNIQDSGWIIADTTNDLSYDNGNGLFQFASSFAGGTADLTIAATNTGGLSVRGYSDSVARAKVDQSGTVFWSDGSAAADASLRRPAADLLGLGTGDALVIGSTAGDHASTTNGTISYDSTSNKFDFRENGAYVNFIDTLTLSGDAGSDQTITDGNTLEMEGGYAIDTTGAATDKITFDFDPAEVTALASWGGGASNSWLWNVGAVDPKITFSTGLMNLNPDGDDTDVVIEGDTDANLLTVDAGAEKVGISTSGPLHTLDVGGSFGPHSLRTVSGAGPTTLDSTDFVALINLSGGATHTLNLPAASGCTGRIYMLRRIDTDFTSTLTLEPNGTDAWEGTGSGNTTIGVAGMLIIVSDGSGWYMLSQS